MTDAEVNKARTSFIEAIQKFGVSLEPLASSSALQAIRKPQDEDLMEQARRHVTQHDARREATDEVIKLVWKFWPNQKAEAS